MVLPSESSRTLVAALGGELDHSHLGLGDLDPDDQARYRGVLEQVNALAVEARSGGGGETLEAAEGIRAAVLDHRVDAHEVIEAVAAHEDPAEGVHAIAVQLGIVPMSLLEAAEERREDEQHEDAVEALDRLAKWVNEREAERRRKREKR